MKGWIYSDTHYANNNRIKSIRQKMKLNSPFPFNFLFSLCSIFFYLLHILLIKENESKMVRIFSRKLLFAMVVGRVASNSNGNTMSREEKEKPFQSLSFSKHIKGDPFHQAYCWLFYVTFVCAMHAHKFICSVCVRAWKIAISFHIHTIRSIVRLYEKFNLISSSSKIPYQICIPIKYGVT